MPPSIPIRPDSKPPRVKAYAIDLPVAAVDVLQREARGMDITFKELMSRLVTAEAMRYETSRAAMDCITG